MSYHQNERYQIDYRKHDLTACRVFQCSCGFMDLSVALEYGFKTIKLPLPLKQFVSDQNKLITDAS